MNNNFYYNNNNKEEHPSNQKDLLLIFASIVLIAIGYIMMTSGMFDKVSKVETTIDNKIVYQGKDELVKVKIKTNNEFNPVVKFRSKNGKFTVSEEKQEGKEVETKIIAKESGEDILIVEVGRDEGKKDKVEEVKVLICEEPKLLNTTDKTLSIKEETNLQLKFNVDDKCLEGYQIYVENDKVADIDNNYVLNAKKSGKTTLVLKGSKTIKYTLNVRPLKVNVTGVKINTKAFNLAIGKTKSLSVSVKPSDATNKKVTYESSNPSVATVTAGGKVKGISTGVAIITVTTEENSKTDTIKVKVYKPETPVVNPPTTVRVTSIKFNKASETMYEGESKTLSTTIMPSNATNKAITCSSSNDSIVKVSVSNNSCLVKGAAVGTATITVTTKDGAKNATASVTVSKKPVTTISVTGIKFDKTSESVYVGESKSLTATISPANATNKAITCTSSDNSIATVSVSGNSCVVKGVAVGIATITVTTKDGGKTSTIKVTVSKKPTPTVSVTSVKFEKSSYSVSLNQTIAAVVGVTPTNATNKAITCKSLNTGIATVTYSGNICTIKGVKVGTTTIEAYSVDGNKKATTEVTVLPIAVTSISFESISYSINAGASKTLNVKFNPTNASNQVISCSSSNNSIATVSAKNASCVVKGASKGKVNITATSQDGNKTATVSVTVNSKVITIAGKTYTTRYKNIGGFKGYPQNFAIANFGKSNEILYVSASGIGNIAKGSTDKNELELLNTSIINKYEIKDNKTAVFKERMYLKDTGHAQPFDYDTINELIITNDYKTDYITGNRRYGSSTGLMGVKFTKVDRGGTYIKLGSYNLNSSHPAPIIDSNNKLFGTVTGTTVKLYDYNYNTFVNGKFNFANPKKTFTIKRSTPRDTSIPSQGFALYEGCLYELSGAYGGAAYIEAFDLNGESLYKTKLENGYSSANTREVEGIKIYNDTIYILSTYAINGSRKVDVGYYK
jgi:uncharacterized protein YjdB